MPNKNRTSLATVPVRNFSRTVICPDHRRMAWLARKSHLRMASAVVTGVSHFLGKSQSDLRQVNEQDRARRVAMVEARRMPVPLPGKRRGRRNFVCFSRCRACEWLDTYKSDGHPFSL